MEVEGELKRVAHERWDPDRRMGVGEAGGRAAARGVAEAQRACLAARDVEAVWAIAGSRLASARLSCSRRA
jgi:hypothetical protein